MNIDWLTIATVAGPVLGVVVGLVLGRVLEQKPKLIAYFTHASAFVLPGPPSVGVHTHGIVIKNAGRKAASDIRVRHNVRPSQYVVFPSVAYTDLNLAGGGFEIVFPRLVPNEQVSLSYLYSPPLLYNQIHGAIVHSEGFATEVSALPTAQYAPWLSRLYRILVVVGIITCAYVLVEVARLALRWWHPT